MAHRPRRRTTAFVLVAGLVALTAGCSTPTTATGTLDAGRQRVAALVLDAAHALPATVSFTPPQAVGTLACRKKFAGFVIGRTGAHRAEVPLLVKVDPGTGRHLLDVIGASWRAAGYTLDRSRIDEGDFPQLSANTPDGYHVVATALTRPPAAGQRAQLNLYAVSPCLRGS